MILNDRHIDSRQKQLINDVVGSPFSFFQTIFKGNVDSKLMVIDEISDYLKELLGDFAEGFYGSMELRPNGILIRFHQNLKTIIWVLTYHELKLKITESVKISENNNFIKITNSDTLRHNKSFFKKLRRLKTQNVRILSRLR